MDEVILKLLGLLEQLTEERGVPKNNDDLIDKNIVNSEDVSNEKRVPSTLSTNEKKRLEQSFTIFNKLFFDYQKKMMPDEKEKTLVQDIAKKQNTTVIPAGPHEEKGSGMLSMIIGGIALLGASVGGIIASISGFFGDSASKVIESFGKLGMMGALKMLSKTILKKLAVGVLKKMPFIGGIIGLYFAYDAFKQGNIFKGVAELISALLNFVPGIGPILSIGADLLIAWADSKGVFSEGGALSPENGWKTIKGWMASIGKTIMDNALYLPIIGTFKRFGMAIDSFKSGDIGEGLKQIGLGLFTMIPGGGLLIKGIEVLAGWLNSPKTSEGEFNENSSWVDKMKGWLKTKLKDLPYVLRKPLEWLGIIPDSGDDSTVSKEVSNESKNGSKGIIDYVGGIWDKVKGPMGDSIGVIGQFATDAWNNTKEYASKAWDVVSEEAPKIWDSIKDVSSKAWDVTKQAGSWFSDTISEMATKTKNLINEWIPGIVDTISGIATGAMDVLKSIANKIGGWIAGLFSSDEEKKLKEVTKQAGEKQELITNTSLTNASIENLVKGSIVQNQWMENLHKASIEQVRLLGNLVNISSSSLQELKRMSGNKNSNNTTIIQQPKQAQKTSMIPIMNNRDGFASSPYALS